MSEASTRTKEYLSRAVSSAVSEQKSDSPGFSAILASKVWKEASSMSVFCTGHPLGPLRPRLAAEGIVTAGELRRIPSGRRVRVTGLLVMVHTPPTRSGKRVMFITMEDESGLMDLVMFPKAQADYARLLLTSEVLTAEGALQRQGHNGISISIVVEKLVPSLTGSLSNLLAQIGGHTR
jgi:DNA polymerase III alpha subunit